MELKATNFTKRWALPVGTQPSLPNKSIVSDTTIKWGERETIVSFTGSTSVTVQAYGASMSVQPMADASTGVARITTTEADGYTRFFLMTEDGNGGYNMVEECEDEFSDDSASESDDSEQDDFVTQHLVNLSLVPEATLNAIENAKEVWNPYVSIGGEDKEVLGLLSGMDIVGADSSSRMKSSSLWNNMPDDYSAALRTVVSKLKKASKKDRRFKCWVCDTTAALHYLVEIQAPWGVEQDAKIALENAAGKPWFRDLGSSLPHAIPNALAVTPDQQLEPESSSKPSGKSSSQPAQAKVPPKQPKPVVSQPVAAKDKQSKGGDKKKPSGDSFLCTLNEDFHDCEIGRLADGAISIQRKGVAEPIKAYLSKKGSLTCLHPSEHTLLLFFDKPADVMSEGIDHFLGGKNIVTVMRDEWNPATPRPDTELGMVMDDFRSKILPALDRWNSMKPVKQAAKKHANQSSSKKVQRKKATHATSTK